MAKLVDDKCCQSCWHGMDRPCPDLVNCLVEGPVLLQRVLPRAAQGGDGESAPRALQKPVIFVGAGTCGLGAGAGKTIAAIKEYLADKNIHADVRRGRLHRPVLRPSRWWTCSFPGRTRVSFGGVTAEKVAGAAGRRVRPAAFPADQLLGQFRHADGQRARGRACHIMDEHPFFAPQTRWVLANCGMIDPDRIEEYIARGGYKAFAAGPARDDARPSCATWSRPAACAAAAAAGSPPARSGSSPWPAAGDQKYLICNADEGDPGAFMDRAVIEGDPHRAAGRHGHRRLRHRRHQGLHLHPRRIPAGHPAPEEAIAQAKAYGLLGENILDSGFSLDIVIKMGAGAFVCGEETALIHSIEGKRGMPRPRPPFPAVAGLFGKPTVINNVETLANLPPIIDQRRRAGSPPIGTGRQQGHQGLRAVGQGAPHRPGRSGHGHHDAADRLRHRRRHRQRQEVQGRPDRRALRRLHSRAASGHPDRLRIAQDASARSWAPAAWSSWTKTPAWWTWPSSSWTSSSGKAAASAFPAARARGGCWRSSSAITRGRRQRRRASTPWNASRA